MKSVLAVLLLGSLSVQSLLAFSHFPLPKMKPGGEVTRAYFGSPGAIYLNRDNSFKVDDRTGGAGDAARDIERSELEAIKSALEKRVAEQESK